MWIQQERSPKCNYFPGITENLIFFFFTLKLKGKTIKRHFALRKCSPFWNILQWFFFLVTGESDDSASAPFPEVQSSCVKQDGQKLLQGHLYYAVFPVVNHCAVSIFPSLIYFCSLGFNSDIVIILFLKDKLLFYPKTHSMYFYCLWKAARWTDYYKAVSQLF